MYASIKALEFAKDNKRLRFDLVTRTTAPISNESASTNDGSEAKRIK